MSNEDEQFEEISNTPNEETDLPLEWDNSFDEAALTNNWPGFESQALGLRYITVETSEGLVGIAPNVLDTSIGTLDRTIQSASETGQEVEFIVNTLDYLRQENRRTAAIPREINTDKRLSIVSVRDRIAQI